MALVPLDQAVDAAPCATVGQRRIAMASRQRPGRFLSKFFTAVSFLPQMFSETKANTLSDKFPPDRQRAALVAFAKALGSRDSALRRDECGDWKIVGARGHVYAVPAGFQFFVLGWSALGWGKAKRDLSFAALCNDGDGEGGFILTRLPAGAEALSIRKWAGIAKKRDVSDAERERLRQFSREHGFARAA